MTKLTKTIIPKLALLLCLLFPIAANAEQFIDLTAEIETVCWSYHFVVDGLDGKARSGTELPSLFTRNQTVHCVIGTNVWFMESVPGAWLFNGEEQFWFTGSNVIRNDQITKEFTDPGGFVHRVGEHHVHVYDSDDGNPGRPIKVADLLELGQHIPWLAFCSGSVLKMKSRHLFPPSMMWKGTIDGSHGFFDNTSVYNDSLGLPVSMALFANTNQTVFRYQVHQTTNVLGWHFPLEFYMAQYEPDNTNGWEVSFTARGRITAIKPGVRPQIPEFVIIAAKNKYE